MTDSAPLQQHEPLALPERSTGRIVRSVFGYSLLLALMFLTPIVVFVPAVMFACGMKNGKLAAIIMVALGAPIALFLDVETARFAGASAGDAMSGYSYLLALVVAVCVPAIAVLPLVERGETFGRVLVTAIIASITGLGATEAAMQAGYGFSPYHEQVVRAHQTAAAVLATYQKAGVPSRGVSVMKQWLDIGITCLPAFIVIDIIVVFVLSLVMFGRLKAWRDFVRRHETAGADRAPIAATYLFRNLTLPDWLLFAFVVGGMTPLASGMLQKVTGNILVVVAFLYLLQGLAIFRSLLVAVGAGFGGVMFGYFILGLLTITGISPFLLSIAGLFDSFFDFRHFRRKDHSDESHPH